MLYSLSQPTPETSSKRMPERMQLIRGSKNKRLRVDTMSHASTANIDIVNESRKLGLNSQLQASKKQKKRSLLELPHVLIDWIFGM